MRMADKDTITKKYMQDKVTFADVFNFLLYDGEQVIKPDQSDDHHFKWWFHNAPKRGKYLHA